MRGESFVLEQDAQRIEDPRLVVDDEDARSGWGRVTHRSSPESA
jgi:hypothetical protein